MKRIKKIHIYYIVAGCLSIAATGCFIRQENYWAAVWALITLVWIINTALRDILIEEIEEDCRELKRFCYKKDRANIELQEQILELRKKK